MTAAGTQIYMGLKPVLFYLLNVRKTARNQKLPILGFFDTVRLSLHFARFLLYVTSTSQYQKIDREPKKVRFKMADLAGR